ncbi:methyltransferase, FxLD system [Streptomyces sp. V4I23]|uniref:methyltransferase, FxLD system n=1 Tax=Streptomyces sp. V4I23 TaxID=3042282 RepID=UPI0027D795CA|nr:methyltransferase, FxLD system [Streptomyces sp. V4I23]
MTTAAERHLAAEHWLLSATPDPEEARGEWRDRNVALLPCGTPFAAVRIPARLVQAAARTTDHAVIDAYLARALLDGPVICDRHAGWYYALVPASCALRWDVADTVCLGRESSLGVPGPGRTGLNGERLYWSAPMDSAGMLCSVYAVAQLVMIGRYLAVRHIGEADAHLRLLVEGAASSLHALHPAQTRQGTGNMTHLETASPDALRADMVRVLHEQDAIVSAAVAAAFTAVPRHRFAPEATLEAAYDLHGILPVKQDENGLNLSVISAAHLQAVMLEQAGIEPGMRVLEIGSGGYNAAIIQELVGADGEVTTLDIDRDVIERARQHLDDTGYDRVKTVVADAETALADLGTFDRIIATVATWDIPLSWISALGEKGRLVTPLTVCGTTRSVAFERDGDGLVSLSYRLCHFVPMQGEGAAPDRKVMLREGVALQTDNEQVPLNAQALGRALEGDRLEKWSGAAYDLPDELEWFMTLNLPSPARLHASQDVIDSGLVEPSARLGVAALASEDSIAYRTRRPNATTGTAGFESGVIAHGPQAEALAEQYAQLLRRWAQEHQRRGAATIRYVPGAAPSPLPPGAARKRHGYVTVTWA